MKDRSHSISYLESRDVVLDMQIFKFCDLLGPADVDASGGRPAAVHEYFRAEIVNPEEANSIQK